MKIKTIKLDYTTGTSKEITPAKVGFIITNEVLPTADWSMDDAYQAMATLMLSTMAATVDNYGTYAPLFDKFEETVSAVKRQLSPEQFAKDFALKYHQAFLYDEIMEDSKLPEDQRKYKDLFDKMIDFAKRAAEKMKAK